MLLSKVFITQVIRHPDMLKRILGLVVDEAHVVSHWGSRGTPFVAMSATLPPRVRNDVLSKLQYDLRHFLDRDLWFLIPAVLRSILDIKKAFVYADTIHVARDIEDYLYSLCPEEMRKEGFIRPYSAAFSVEYREAVMEQFKVGKVRILICTDDKFRAVTSRISISSYSGSFQLPFRHSYSGLDEQLEVPVERAWRCCWSRSRSTRQTFRHIFRPTGNRRRSIQLCSDWRVPSGSADASVQKRGSR